MWLTATWTLTVSFDESTLRVNARVNVHVADAVNDNAHVNLNVDAEATACAPMTDGALGYGAGPSVWCRTVSRSQRGSLSG